MSIIQFRNDSVATIYLNSFGHQQILVGEVVDVIDEETRLKDDSQITTLLNAGDLILIDDAGSDRTAAEALKILKGTVHLVRYGGAPYDLLCTDPSGDLVWSPGSILIKEEGTLVNSIPFNILNFVGGSITATDATAGQVDITVSVASDLVDRQLASATVQTTTTSTVYVDLDSCTLTTKNLGEAGTYVVSFSAKLLNVDVSKNSFILNIDGTDVLSTERVFEPTKNKYVSIAFTHLATGVADGTIIKIRYKREGAGTLKIEERSLVIDGVKDSNIVV